EGGAEKEGRGGAGRLGGLYVFPIKSCAPQRIGCGKRWLLGRRGLAYDREWAIVDPLNRSLRLKQVHGLPFVRATPRSALR
ncbi:unnamed protein product, partial [Discosporangium mesarthrocarpum]